MGASDLGFALEAPEPLGIVGEKVWQDLERHVAVELRVAGAVDLPHAAGADLGGDVVMPEAVAYAEGHRLGIGGSTHRQRDCTGVPRYLGVDGLFWQGEHEEVVP